MVSFATFTKVDASLIALATSFTVATLLSASVPFSSVTFTLPRSASAAPVLTVSKLPLVTDAPSAVTVNKLSAPSLAFTLIVPSVSSLRPSPTFVFATSTVTTCLPPSVFADTVAEPVPTNSTSAAFFTAAWKGVLVSPVVLLEESTQPKPRKSPTVAAVLSATVVAAPPAPAVGLLKLTKSLLASLPLYLDKPLATLVICLLPALMPSLVTLTTEASVAPAPAGVMVKPSLLITVFSPFSVPKVTLVKPVKVSFSE